jgi:TRAP-type C4-dicarboxylate transport system substrate-binding protein
MVRIARIRVLLVAGLALVLLAGCAGSGADKAGGRSARKVVVLTLADPFGDTQELDGFAMEVNRLSGGTMRIDVKIGWRYGQVTYENGLIGDVRAGKADLGVAGSRAWDSVGVTSLRALNAPLLIDSYALQDRVVRSPLIAPMLKGLEPLGLVGLGVLPGPLRRPFGVLRPLRGPSDYSGLRIGVQQSRIGSATLRVLGATPVWFPVAAPIAGLDAIEQHITAIPQYERVVKYLTTNVVLWPRPLVVFASRSAFGRLTPAQQRILREAVADDYPAETKFVSETEQTETANLCRSGLLRFVTASRADRVALRRTVQPIYADLERDPQTRREIAQIQAMRRQVEPGAAPHCGHGGPSVGANSQLDGVWRMTTKFGDEPADPTPVSENYGDWIFVFDRGHFADTQEYLDACTWGYGTLTVTRPQMAWTFTDGGGIQPHGAANKPGEFFRFGWSLYRDTLTLTPVQGAVSPLNFRGRPWRRLSTTPSRNYFSKRCPPPPNALSG